MEQPLKDMQQHLQDEEQPYILQMQDIVKRFPGVLALGGVSLDVKRGTVHAICGENGAGKSTLMKVLSGIHPHGTYEGRIIFMGKEVCFRNIKESEQAGIAIIHQELTMIPELSITENIFVGSEITKNGLINWDAQREHAKELLEKVGLDINPDILVKKLGVGQQQLVEIAKALSKDVKLLILDEPTSALNQDDTENLFKLMRDLIRRDVTCIMISHKLDEIAEISDTVTVIRDGCTVDILFVEDGQIDENRIIRSMVGRSLENRFPPHDSKPGEVIFEVDNWCVEDPDVHGRLKCKNSSFYVRAGEIVGFAGLMGAGRTELMRSIFGKNYGNCCSGTMKIHGKTVEANSVSSAIKLGIAYIPEDRKNLGLNLIDTFRKTSVAANLKAILRRRLLDLDKEFETAENHRKMLGIKARDVNTGINTLSGGNQQKVVIGKWLFTEPDILILDEPTRGIDVGAKYEIHRLIQELANDGKAVILISSELPELLGMSDRIYTIFEGKITGELSREEADQEKLMRMMINASPDEEKSDREGNA